MDFQDLLALNGSFMGQNWRRGGAICWPNELVFTFGGSYVHANFGENRSRNATVRVHTDRMIHTRIHRQTQTGFIICFMLYAITMGQTKIEVAIVKLTAEAQIASVFSYSACCKLFEVPRRCLIGLIRSAASLTAGACLLYTSPSPRD